MLVEGVLDQGVVGHGRLAAAVARHQQLARDGIVALLEVVLAARTAMFMVSQSQLKA
jgi:hypothetical protein